MKKIYILLLVLVSITACKINQKQNGLRHGKWITSSKTEYENFKYIEKYKKGEEVKTWKTYRNKKLYKREIHKNNISYVTYYNENKKVITRGKTRYDKNSNSGHWYYFGDWNYYDEEGKLIMIRKYKNGDLESEIELN